MEDKSKAKPPRIAKWQKSLIINGIALLVIVGVMLLFCYISATVFSDPNNRITRVIEKWSIHTRVLR